MKKMMTVGDLVRRRSSKIPPKLSASDNVSLRRRRLFSPIPENYIPSPHHPPRHGVSQQPDLIRFLASEGIPAALPAEWLP